MIKLIFPGVFSIKRRNKKLISPFRNKKILVINHEQIIWRRKEKNIFFFIKLFDESSKKIIIVRANTYDLEIINIEVKKGKRHKFKSVLHKIILQNVKISRKNNQFHPFTRSINRDFICLSWRQLNMDHKFFSERSET